MDDSYKDILPIIDMSEPCASAPEQHTSNLFIHLTITIKFMIGKILHFSRAADFGIEGERCNIILYRAIVVEGDTALATPFKSSASPNIHRHDASSIIISSHHLCTSSDTFLDDIQLCSIVHAGMDIINKIMYAASVATCSEDGQ